MEKRKFKAPEGTKQLPWDFKKPNKGFPRNPRLYSVLI
jgi:hypothetical protein